MANVFLKNTGTKWQSNLMNLSSAQLLLGSQTMDQMKNWFIFVDDGQDQWLNVLDCPLVVDLFREATVEAGSTAVDRSIANSEEPVTKSLELPKEFYNPEIHATPAPAPIEEKPSNRRAHPRFDIRLRVIIKSGKHTFLTYTSDVSLGGLSLINDVPDYIFKGEAEIYITAPDNKNNLMLICSPVASTLGRSRLMFAKMEESKQKVLQNWLHHVVKPNLKPMPRSS